jgi:hypothetical protein
VTADRTSVPGAAIILTYGFAGALRLQALLAARSELACTTGTGVLQACQYAADAWRRADDRRDGPLSAAATASVRALANGLVIALLARMGKPRWCETVAAEPSAAETFLDVFPGTRFICLHRACPDVIYATLKSSPWGVSGPQYAGFTSSYPGSTVAALSAWWCSHAGPLLEFEKAHPGICLRLRYEDLVGDPATTEQDVLKFLDLPYEAPALPPVPDAAQPAVTGADAPGCGADIPAGQIPAFLGTQVNALHAQLGYQPLPARQAGG